MVLVMLSRAPAMSSRKSFQETPITLRHIKVRRERIVAPDCLWKGREVIRFGKSLRTMTAGYPHSFVVVNSSWLLLLATSFRSLESRAGFIGLRCKRQALAPDGVSRKRRRVNWEFVSRYVTLFPCLVCSHLARKEAEKFSSAVSFWFCLKVTHNTHPSYMSCSGIFRLLNHRDFGWIRVWCEEFRGFARILIRFEFSTLEMFSNFMKRNVESWSEFHVSRKSVFPLTSTRTRPGNLGLNSRRASSFKNVM